jgi:hypothetical protein
LHAKFTRQNHRGSAPGGSARRRGQAQVEFAILAYVLYLLLAVTIDMGRALYSGQFIQQAADVLARELTRTPLPAEYTLYQALDDPDVKLRIFDEGYLEVDLEKIPPQFTWTDWFADKPVVNQLLLPLMIVETRGDRRFLVYPGARRRPENNGRWSVPVLSRAGGAETILEWVPVVEEILPPPPEPQIPSPFQLSSVWRGRAMVRLNYPFQAATLTAYTYRTAGGAVDNPLGQDNVQNIPVQVPGPQGGPYGPYAGADGLGRQAALGQTVRPFRRLLTAQAIYQREVFR